VTCKPRTAAGEITARPERRVGDVDAPSVDVQDLRREIEDACRRPTAEMDQVAIDTLLALSRMSTRDLLRPRPQRTPRPINKGGQMRTLKMHVYALRQDLTPAQVLKENITLAVEDAEASRMAAVRKELGGLEDAQAWNVKHQVMLFRRLDPSAPGGVGRMVAAQILTPNGRVLRPGPNGRSA
jgi:hypothetical protein